METQILDTWRIHNRINLYLLDAIAPEALQGTPPGMKGRSVGEAFAHMHNVRLMWLESAAPDLMPGLTKLEKTQASDREALRQALTASGEAIETLLQRGMSAGGKIKGFKPHAVAFMGYLISHESHHRGEIGLLLSQMGHRLDKKVDYGMWEWGVR
ncbi:MAG TPA: DinB family protein [Chloroflexia bacterium]|jgi:uncharacterized damage-inducible protein DinB